MKLAGDQQPGLVEPGGLGLDDEVLDLIEEPVQLVGGPRGHGPDGALGHRDAEQFEQSLGGEFLRHELAHIQIQDDRGDPRPVLHRRGHTRRRRAAGRGPARAAPRDQLMLGHPHRHRWQVEHLPQLHTHLGRGRQISTASGAMAGLMPQPLVRIGHQRQCRPRMPGLPARLAAALATQRLRRGLGERRIRRRRLRRVLRILPQLPPQLGDLGLELRDPLGLNSDEIGKLLRSRGAADHQPRLQSDHRRPRRVIINATRHSQTTTNTKSLHQSTSGRFGMTSIQESQNFVLASFQLLKPQRLVECPVAYSVRTGGRDWRRVG